MPKAKIAIVCPYPQGISPGQRFRFEQYLNYLNQHDINYQIFAFLTPDSYAVLYQPGNYFAKVMAVLRGFFIRILLLFKLYQFTHIWLYREATPFGFPWFEWVATKIARKPLIFDFDDAIWRPQFNDKQGAKINQWFNWFRYHAKTAKICKWASIVTCGNQFLCNWAMQYNKNVRLIPTTIDTDNLHHPQKNHTQAQAPQPLVIGWTGTHTTLYFLEPLYPVITQLVQKYPHLNLQLRIIANTPPKFTAPWLQFVKWQKQTEIADLLSFDIGVMPLYNTEWEQGKCGFKALQYMALGIPAAVSPVGVNNQIVKHQQNRLLAQTPEEWFNCLEALILNPQTRQKLGQAGRQTVLQNYSVQSNKNKYLLLFTKEYI